MSDAEATKNEFVSSTLLVMTIFMQGDLRQHLSEMNGHNVDLLIEGVGGADTDDITHLLRRHRFDRNDVNDKYTVSVIVAGGNNIYSKDNWKQPGTVPRATSEKLLRLMRTALHVAQRLVVMFPKALLKDGRGVPLSLMMYRCVYDPSHGHRFACK